jgi:hypothetical protein
MRCNLNNFIKILYRHRMSDDTGSTSILTNLQNKLTYNILNAVTDPKANEYAKQQQDIADKKKQEEENKKKEEATEKEGDPNKFSTTRLLKKVTSQTSFILRQVFNPFVALMLAMIVANEMIVYSAPIRVIFFIFTFIICLFLPFYTIILAIFYILKGSYSYYVNNMTDRPNRNIMPTIFALLPITTFKPQSSFGAFFMYPFTYPKTELAEQKLPEIMNDYWLQLISSFKNFDKFKLLSPFSQDIQKAERSLRLIHGHSSEPKVNN